ncbi:uncharacterized protein H6S33_009684 [Morchella sextelata]|uniref:uncharacterized protein n=1 Tax=Morchella sextelata TaxID=1174677 RepID=UPI001D051E6D|nr:uncharacterized protein H6S33_009684 [Morchella sextelata]KAH0613304.1 hypothetical protein H6S33_009684 [Morchella sextelata]
MSSSTATPSRKSFTIDWDKRVDEVKVTKTDLNALVMNYLVIEGYNSAAVKFAQEANISPQIDLESIQERVEIRNAIHRGDIQSAKERINELNPEILDTNPSLHFALLRLQLIELIRKCTSDPDGDISAALTFATNELAPRAPSNPAFLKDLERTMALLCFPPASLAPPLAGLMDPALRKEVARKVNEAILEAQGVQKEARIRRLVRLRAWSEQRMRSEKKDIPLMDLGLDLGQAVDEPMGSCQ